MDPRQPKTTPLAPSKEFLHCQADTCEIEIGRAAREVVVSRPCMSSECPTNQGVLTERAVRQADELAVLLSEGKLAAGYGCPRCADGWLFEVRLWPSANSVKRVSYDPDESSELPAALIQLTELVRTVRAALLSCTPNELVTPSDLCEPTR